MKFKALVCSTALLAGCTTTLPADQMVVDPYVPVVPEIQQAPRAVTGSIFMDQNSSRMFGHKRQFRWVTLSPWF